MNYVELLNEIFKIITIVVTCLEGKMAAVLRYYEDFKVLKKYSHKLNI